jgi:hypothetical protein
LSPRPPARRPGRSTAHRAKPRLSGGDALPSIRAALGLLGGGRRRPTAVGLFATAIVPPEGVVATSIAAWAAARERFGMALAAHVGGRALALGAPRAQIRPPCGFRDFEPDNFYRASWVGRIRVFDAANRRAEADGCSAPAVNGDPIAADHVRAEFRESFLHRNRSTERVSAALRLPGSQAAAAKPA